ncbi:MAG: sulfatase-like hydrolase/transferase [Candidatus Aminicenantes bacterium]|nr:sulfatase-like hydrolase/transferase [Candidatus Aminicenantes bacterium]
MKNSRSILVIGLDGLCWDVISPLLERGYLSNLARLIKDGSSGYLQTIAPTFTPAVWTSIATGKLPVKHGIMDFRTCTFKGMTGSVRQFPPYFGIKGILERMDNILPFDLLKYLPVTSELWLSRPVWDVLSEYEKKVGIVGWYPTWPVYEVNGFLVTERAHCLDLEKCVYPNILREEVNPFIELRHQCHRPSHETVLAAGPLTGKIDQFMELSDMKDGLLPEDSDSRPELEILKFEYLKDTTYMNIAQHLFGKYHDLDFRAVYLHGPDAVAHNFWKWREPEYYRDVDENDIRMFSKVIDKYYIHMDKFIGRLLQNIDENTVVMIISDHGERPLYGGHWRHRTQTTHDLSTPGVVILWGKDIKKGQKLEEAGVLDITPTILYLMNLPVGHDMDGKVLTEAIEERLLDELPAKYISSYGKWRLSELKPSASSADAEIERRLKGLGYID